MTLKLEFRTKFAELATLPDEALPLDEAALLIAAETGEPFDVSDYLRKLDVLANQFNSDGRYNTDLGIPVAGLIDYIHNDLRFSGNVSDYYDPSNSYLNRVIDFKSGIPISLALVHMAIGSRLGISVVGISFPGHFLVRYGGSSGTIVDPFSGRELSKADCQTLLRQIAGSRANLKDEYFDVASSRDILIRMLDNLKQIFWRKKAWDESKACIDRQLLLLPEREEFNIQLGAVYEMQGNVLLAEQTYSRVLTLTTDDALKELASKRLLAMDTTTKTVH
ncbi:MAG: regulator of sirC expression with transglutaminase-like and TPR domain [Candidatus Azotimanducaceae bacterium]|jgi:regulator of sirC expression with transglutaminase-like and TPR domain